MPDLDEARAAFRQAAGDGEQARQAEWDARSEVIRLRQRIAAVERGLRPGDQEGQALHDRLQRALAQAEGSREASRGRLTEALAAEGVALGRLAEFLDPTEAIRSLDDRIPILLMPLRLETRFRRADDQAPELLVRVFPDEWAGDHFEPGLSDTEVANAAAFWAGYWASAGLEHERIAAWRDLVAAHGAGRAQWIVSQYRPVDESAEPPPKAPHDVVLVIATEVLPPADQRTALATYWEALWRTPDDPAAADDARAALVADPAVGDAATADTLIAAYEPRNLAADPPPNERAGVGVSTAWLELPSAEDAATKAVSWSAAARTSALPERLVLILRRGEAEREVLGSPIPSSLQLGPDPAAIDNDQLGKDGADLTIPDELRWVFDFDRAVEVGLGFRVPLSEAEAAGGFDRVLVVGVTLFDDSAEGAARLEALLEHHHYSNTGIELLPQGSATNNTESGPAAYTFEDDVEGSYARVFGILPGLDATDAEEKLDGQWLAEWLGIRPEVVQRLTNADARDQLEIRAMNTLLWPATGGYTMEEMLGEAFDAPTRRQTYELFREMVVPRGVVPALRIGEQPYGILPATRWSEMTWLAPRRFATTAIAGSSTYLARLHALLLAMDQRWQTLQSGAAHLDRPGDAHQVLLDVLGLHATSVEYHQRWSDSYDYYVNLFNYQRSADTFQALLDAFHHRSRAWSLLGTLGYGGDELPALLERVFRETANLLTGPIIDDVDLSEAEPIRPYTDDGRNYLEWLADAARTSLDTVRNQDGFSDDERPRALLYQLARHALQLGYWDAGLRLHEEAPDPVIDGPTLVALRKEPAFVHVAGGVEVSESKYHHLYQAAPSITGSDDLPLESHIRNVLLVAPQTAALAGQLAALDRLAATPTARLERLLAEHVDALSYRLDAWKQALVNVQLHLMRFGRTAEVTRTGIYLGAYGWLENLAPRESTLAPAALDQELLDAFGLAAGEALEDSANQGFLHAPSLNQAVAAAILRNGYLSNEDDAGPLAVNLTSRRVRKALAVIEGVRGDQSLGELLGYQLERSLHDDYALAETDEFIYELRKKFPLASNELESTREDLPPGASIATIEARNVVDGWKLSEHITRVGDESYPFGLLGLATADPAQTAKIDAAVADMRSTHDAVADLTIAESVFQAAVGNIEGAAATLDAYGKGELPPLPGVIETSREGVGITQRFVLRLDADPPAGSPWAGVALTPRAEAEPAINRFVASLLPLPGDIVCKVERLDTNATAEVSAFALGLQPIDLLYVVRTGAGAVSSELDDRLEVEFRTSHGPMRADVGVRLRHTDEVPGKATFFELAPLFGSLRRMLAGGRRLRASDLALEGEATASLDEGASLLRSRADAARTALADVRGAIDTPLAAVEALLADTEANRAALLSGAEGRQTAYLPIARRLAAFGFPEADIGWVAEWKAGFFRDLDARLEALVADWERRADEFSGLLARYDALPAAATLKARFAALQRCERLVSTTVTTPLPADPDDFRTIVVAHKAAFDARLAGLTALSGAGGTVPADYLDALRPQLPLDAFVDEPFEVTAEEDRIIRSNAELAGHYRAMRDAADTRLAGIDAGLAAHDAATEPDKRVAALEGAFLAAFGDEFRALARFRVGADQAAELANVDAAHDDLVRHARNTLGRSLVVDEWLYSMARVREKVAEWEHTVVTAEGLTGHRFDLIPWQLPYRADDHWMATDYPDDYDVSGERLLVTGYHAVPFVAGDPQVGLLIDEWTEVIPIPESTTGVTFHFDQPNSEPPQTMLLVTPTDFREGWLWSDVVGAVDETLDAAKQRAVEPDQVQGTAFSALLPATTAAVTYHPITIAMNLAAVNGITAALAED